MKFEENIKELEEIVNKLENGDSPLDESFEMYSKAMNLIKECDKKLNEVKENVNKIVSENGQLENFTIDEDAK